MNKPFIFNKKSAGCTNLGVDEFSVADSGLCHRQPVRLQLFVPLDAIKLLIQKHVVSETQSQIISSPSLENIQKLLLVLRCLHYDSCDVQVD